MDTPYGQPSDSYFIGDIGGTKVAFLPRHGRRHQLPPHMINYRANVWGMKELGVKRIIGPCASGSLNREMGLGHFVVCDQFVDRTWGRGDTFYDGPTTTHVSAADPYCPDLRQALIAAGRELGITVHERGTVVVIQGPRFSTRAESKWFSAMGWDVINMTGYPEGYLARELELCYANISLVTDYRCRPGRRPHRSAGEPPRGGQCFQREQRTPAGAVVRGHPSAGEGPRLRLRQRAGRSARLTRAPRAAQPGSASAAARGQPSGNSTTRVSPSRRTTVSCMWERTDDLRVSSASPASLTSISRTLPYSCSTRPYGLLGRELQRLEQGRHLGQDDLESGERVAFLQFLVASGLLIQVGLAVAPVVAAALSWSRRRLLGRLAVVRHGGRHAFGQSHLPSPPQFSLGPGRVQGDVLHFSRSYGSEHRGDICTHGCSDRFEDLEVAHLDASPQIVDAVDRAVKGDDVRLDDVSSHSSSPASCSHRRRSPVAAR